MLKSKIAFIIAAVLSINLIGILLRYLDLPAFIIAAGFRFHISFIIPAVIFLTSKKIFDLKNIFLESKGKKFYPAFIFTFLPLIILFAILLILNKIKFGKPDYLFEFGVSSLIDFPIYLIWNSIQFIFLFGFLNLISFKKEFKVLKNFLLIAGLFLFELIPLDLKQFNYLKSIEVLLFIFFTAILITKYKNFYMVFLVIFFMCWSDILLFGSNSESLIKILFANNYNEWQGYFIVDKTLKLFISSAHYFIAIILTFFIKADSKDIL